MEKVVSFKDDLESNSTSSTIISGSERNLLARLRQTNSFVRAFQILMVFIFVGALIGALYYAIRQACSYYRSDFVGEVEEKEQFHWIPTDVYSPLFSQFSPEGKGTIVTVTKGQKGEEKEILHSFQTFWYQDDERKEIVHKVDENTVAYVRGNITFYAEIDGKIGENNTKNCILWNEQGYWDYLIAQGLFNMDDRHPVRTLDGQSVYVFDANPPEMSQKHWNWTNFEWGEALLTQAFVDKIQGTLKAWQIHYAVPLLDAMSMGNEYVRRVEYWLPQMKRIHWAEKSEEFERLPKICNIN